jgi:hypothetical protein
LCRRHCISVAHGNIPFSQFCAVGTTHFLMLPMFNPYGVGWSWGCRVSATDIQSLRDIFSFAATSYLSLRVRRRCMQLHQFESAF